MKICYRGIHPRVKFRRVIFEKGKVVEFEFKIERFPADFEVDGKMQKPKTKHTLESLKAKKKSMGWKRFQKWAHDNFGVKDTSESELYEEILDRQEGL